MKPLRITPLLCGLVAVQIAAGSSLWAQETAPVTAAPVTAAPATGLAAPLVKLSPEAASFRDGLAAALTSFGDEERGAIDGFFSARGYTPFWTEPARCAGRSSSRRLPRPAIRRCLSRVTRSKRCCRPILRRP